MERSLSILSLLTPCVTSVHGDDQRVVKRSQAQTLDDRDERKLHQAPKDRGNLCRFSNRIGMDLPATKGSLLTRHEEAA